MNFSDNKKEPITAPWTTILPNSTYLINFYFYLTSEQPAYIYGFATPFRMTEDGMNLWTLSPAKTEPFYIIRGYITGTNLLFILQSAQSNKNIGHILENAGITLKLCDCTEAERDTVFSLFLCNGYGVYRPKYLLSTQEDCAGLVLQQMPNQTFDDDTMYCESLFGINKQSLYSIDGVTDNSRLRNIWALFKEELPVHGNLNELSRINNFEVFSTLFPIVESENAINWEVDCREENGAKIPEHILIHFNHCFLHGAYIVNVRAYNTKNAFLDRTMNIYCNEEDITLRIPLQETLSHATIKVWQTDSKISDTNLIYSSTHSLMRHMHLNMHMTTRSFQIEDDWTRKMEKKNISIDKKGQYYSHHPVSVKDNSEECWVSEESAVQKNIHSLFETHSPGHMKGMFLKEGSDKHIRFLNWFKKLLSNPNITHVILIDPFITSASICQLLRSVGNVAVDYTVVTNHSSDDRITDIKKMEHFLDVIHPEKLKVYAINASKPFLHDRYLILSGKDNVPVVYVLSNSFDNVAEAHASVVIPTDKALASEIYEYYLEHFINFQNCGQFELLYDSTISSPDRMAKTSEISTPKKYTPENFVNTSPTQLIELLEKYIQQNDEHDSKRDNALLLSAAQLILQELDPQGELLEHASQLSDWCHEYDRNHCGWDIYYTIKALWEKEPSLYCKQLTILKEQLEKDHSFSNHRLFRLIASMLGHIAFTLAFGVSDTGLSVLFSSDIPVLRAMAAAKVLSLPAKESLTDNLIMSQLQHLNEVLVPPELLFAEFYQIKELQVLICRHPEEYEKIQPLIDLVIDQAVDTILSIAPTSTKNNSFNDDDLYNYLLPLYFRNSEDICRILLKLWQKNYYSTTLVIQHLIRLFFEKYKKGFSDSATFFVENDLQESCMILKYIEQIDANGISKLKKELSKLERQLGARLYTAFLKTKNYTLWKSSIDLLCCLVFVELWIAKTYHLPPSPAVEEFKHIAANFRATLEKYSGVYRVLIGQFPEMV